MRLGEGSKIVKELKLKGWVEANSVLHAPGSPQALKILENGNNIRGGKRKSIVGLKTGFIDDHRNIKNKTLSCDTFDMLVKKILDIEIWPEFYFSTERAYRIDKALPVDAAGRPIKIGIEIQGGIWLRGASGHSSGTGIKRDMEKNNLAASLGWTIIKIEPYQIEEKHWGQTIDLIKKAIELKNL